MWRAGLSLRTYTACVTSEFHPRFSSDPIIELYHRYASALQALSHALLLAPQNPFTVLQFAETAYTAGDLPLALKMFLVVVDMGERDLENDEPAIGINVRGWFGVKLVCIIPFIMLDVWLTCNGCFSARANLFLRQPQRLLLIRLFPKHSERLTSSLPKES